MQCAEPSADFEHVLVEELTGWEGRVGRLARIPMHHTLTPLEFRSNTLSQHHISKFKEIEIEFAHMQMHLSPAYATSSCSSTPSL